MSLNSLYTEATWATQNWYRPKVVDNFFKSNAIAYYLRRNANVLPGGEKIMLPSLYDSLAASWVPEWGTINAIHQEEYGAGELDWKELVRPVVLSRKQLLKNKESKYRRYRLVMHKNLSAARAMADEFGKAVFSLNYNLTDAIDSLDRAVNDQTGSGDETGYGVKSYAGITRAATGAGATWNAQCDHTSGTFSPSVLNKSWINATEADEHPTLIASNNKPYRLYWDFLTPIQRSGSDELLGKLGHQSVMFNGVPWAIDSHIPSTERSVPDATYGGAPSAAEYIYGFNMDQIELTIHEDAVFEFEEVVAPYDRLVHIGRYYAMLNVANYSPRLSFKLTAITG